MIDDAPTNAAPAPGTSEITSEPAVLKCCTCKRVLLIVNFGRSRSGPHGYYPVCKECRRIADAKSRAKDPDAARARDLVRNRRYRERHREEMRARDRAASKTEAHRARKTRNRVRRAKALPEEYILWGMKQRCRDSRHKSFSQYGARGITVNATFDGSGGLDRFIADVGVRPSPKHTIDRIDNSRGYEPGNMRWVLQSVQNRNTRSNRMLTANGRTMCLADWAVELGVEPSVIRARIDRLGWTVERALSASVRSYKK